MNQCEETEEGVHPSETPLCGQHDNQTKAQRLDSGGSPSSYSEKDVATSDYDSVFSPASGISVGSWASSVSSCVSNQSKTSNDRDYNFKKKQLDFSESPSSDSKKVATDDGDSVWSIDSGLGSLESLSSDLKKDSSRSSDSRKPVMRIEVPFRAAASAPDRLDFSESPFSHPLKDVATVDDVSVLSSDSGISLERNVSSKYRRVSSKRMKPYDRIDSKKKCMLALNECEETEEGVHPSETPLCGQHDNQTKGQSPEKLHEPDSQVLSKPMVRIQALSRSASLSPLDSGESSSSDSEKDVTKSDGDSVQSSDSRISPESLASSGYRRVSNQSNKAKEKTAPPHHPGACSAEIETKSTHLPEAV